MVMRVRQIFIQKLTDGPSELLYGPLLASEIVEAETALLIMVQQEAYPNEVALLKQAEIIPKQSSIFPLTPYIDDKGLL